MYQCRAIRADIFIIASIIVIVGVHESPTLLRVRIIYERLAKSEDPYQDLQTWVEQRVYFI